MEERDSWAVCEASLGANPVQMACWTIPDTLCAPPRAPFDPVRSERRPSGVQSLRMVSGRELLLGLWRPPLALFFFFTVFTWRSGEFRQSVVSLLVSLLVLRYIVEICISFVQIENSVQEDV